MDIHTLYYATTNKFSAGIRLPDPNNIIRLIEDYDREYIILNSGTNSIMIIYLIITIFAILLLRWVFLALFYRRLSFEEKVGEKEIPVIYDIINKYVLKAGIKKPAVSLTYRKYFSSYMVGIRNHILVLSPYLFDLLTTSERSTLIQHELSHIKRHDNLIGWIAIIFRDLLFFNPFAHIAYLLIRSEQEKDSDKLMVKYSGEPVKELAKNVVNTVSKIKALPPSGFTIRPMQNFNIFSPKAINYWRLNNRIKSILKTDPSRIYSRIFPKILMIFLFLILFFIQIVLIIKIDEIIICLIRSSINNSCRFVPLWAKKYLLFY